MPPQLQSRKMVVAIDFGTTFSGVGYWIGRTRPDAKDIKIVSEWPATLPFDGQRPQVPTQIRYHEDGTIDWGNVTIDIPESPHDGGLIQDQRSAKRMEPIRWIKLLLVEQQDLPAFLRANRSEHLQTAQKRLTDLNKDAVTVISDYLKQLWTHAITKIKEIEGRFVVEDCTVHAVITVPAIWKDYARQRMQDAVERAGILKPCTRNRGPVSFSMISEPEAAAHATLRSRVFCNQDIQAGDTILVCDAGGGTVDVISYTIDNTETKQLRECVEGDGDLCGAIFVDEDFQRYLKTRVGLSDWDRTSTADINRALSTDWEHGIKPGFDGSRRLMSIQICGKTIHLNEDEISQSFQRVVTKTKALLVKQVRTIRRETGGGPKFIFLVGGFGRSQWLYRSVDESFPSSQVIRGAGDEPWSAVSRGAALSKAIELCGLEEQPDGQRNLTLSRKARRSIGWTYDMPLDHISNPTTEERSGAQWNDIRGTFMVENTMEWLVRKGQAVDTHEQKRAYSILFPTCETGQMTRTVDILESTSDNPPKRYQEGDPEIRPTKRKVVLQTPVPVEELPLAKNDLGEACFSFDYEWNIKVDGDTISGEVVWENRKIQQLGGLEV